MRHPLHLAGLVLAAALIGSSLASAPAGAAPESHAPQDNPERTTETRPRPRAAPTAAKDAPVKDAPVKDAPVKDAPVKDAPVKMPVQSYVSRGVRSRFCFGAGVHVGVNSLTSKSPIISGASVHFRAGGTVGATLEYDFKRVARTPNPGDVSIEALHFIPNLRIAAVIYPYRWRMLGPFIMLGMGIDTVSNEDRANFQLGFGLEVTFWHDRLAIVAEFRAFIPRPTDVEKHKERLEITGATNIPSTRQYYNVDNLLFTLSARFYY